MSIRQLMIWLLIPFLFAMIGILGYRLLSPEIVVVNNASVSIRELAIQLPASRVVFSDLEPGSRTTIYYGLSNRDGTYQYKLTLDDGRMRTESCGYTTTSEFGKRMEMTVNPTGTMDCKESSKIF